MKATIKHNGKFIQGGLCLVDTSENGVCAILETETSPAMKLDLNRGFIEVNLFGMLEPLEDNKNN